MCPGSPLPRFMSCGCDTVSFTLGSNGQSGSMLEISQTAPSCYSFAAVLWMCLKHPFGLFSTACVLVIYCAWGSFLKLCFPLILQHTKRLLFSLCLIALFYGPIKWLKNTSGLRRRGIFTISRDTLPERCFYCGMLC